MVNVAILGFGTVGSGVAEVIAKNNQQIARRVSNPIEVKYVLDVRDFPSSPFADKVIHDFSIIEKDPEVDVVVETIGGAKIALDFTRRALLAGKSVVTSNKELVATHGYELMQIAKEKNVSYLYEASVGGGIPILKPIRTCLAANELSEITGILNGTTNYILTRMIRAGLSFEDALKMAQQLGYAERNPAADVEGHDACRKICILASLCYGKHIYPEFVHTQGITKMTLADVAYAASWGGVVKLIGQVKKLDDGKLDITVEPMLIEKSSQLAGVDDVFNGILVRGDSTGDVVFYGKGAGKLPTASAVVADIIDCVKHLKERKFVFWEDGDGSLVKPYEKTEYPIYIRAEAEDKKAAAEKAAELFPDMKVIVRADAGENEFAFVTGSMKVADQEKTIAALEAAGVTVQSKIRIAADL